MCDPSTKALNSCRPCPAPPLAPNREFRDRFHAPLSWSGARRRQGAARAEPRSGVGAEAALQRAAAACADAAERLAPSRRAACEGAAEPPSRGARRRQGADPAWGQRMGLGLTDQSQRDLLNGSEKHKGAPRFCACAHDMQHACLQGCAYAAMRGCSPRLNHTSGEDGTWSHGSVAARPIKGQ